MIQDDGVDRPSPPVCTTSLDDYEIPIDPKVRAVLKEQLRFLHNNSDASVEEHLAAILQSLKVAPNKSTCRVNRIICSTRDNAIQKLILHFEEKWDQSHTLNVSIEPHSHLKDVIEITTTSTSPHFPSLSDSHKPPPVAASSILYPSWPRREAQGWPMTHKVVLCDRYCAEAVLRGSHIFVKGILAADAGILPNDIVAVYGIIACDTRKPNRGVLFEQFVASNAHSKCLFLGMGTSMLSRAEFFSNQTGVGITMTVQRAGPIHPPLGGVMTQELVFQNLPSMLVAHALDPQPGEVVLDMCCAPGGKTSHLASLMNNQGVIVACDRSRKKVVSVQESLSGLGATCVTPLALDTTKCVLNDYENDTTVQKILGQAQRSACDGLLEVIGFPPESFDRVLLDPPCTALGLRPKLKIDVKEKDLRKQGEYQQNFIHQAIKLLKPGGRLSYSTCTFNALENETNVAYLLENYKDSMRLLSLDHLPGGSMGLPGYGLTQEQRQCVKRFDPSNRNDNCMGFFIAVFEKQP